jgi:hypothetical protein
MTGSPHAQGVGAIRAEISSGSEVVLDAKNCSKAVTRCQASGSSLVNQLSGSDSCLLRRSEQQIALEDAVDLDLPIVCDETLSVRRNDLYTVLLVSELDRQRTFRHRRRR